MGGCGCLAIYNTSALANINNAHRSHATTRSTNDSTLEMAQLQDLPRELLDLITTEARQQGQAYETLANLSLTCRRLRSTCARSTTSFYRSNGIWTQRPRLPRTHTHPTSRPRIRSSGAVFVSYLEEDHTHAIKSSWQPPLWLWRRRRQ
jgi:hypothetical protein